MSTASKLIAQTDKHTHTHTETETHTTKTLPLLHMREVINVQFMEFILLILFVSYFSMTKHLRFWEPNNTQTVINSQKNHV